MTFHIICSEYWWWIAIFLLSALSLMMYCYFLLNVWIEEAPIHHLFERLKCTSRQRYMSLSTTWEIEMFNVFSPLQMVNYTCIKTTWCDNFNAFDKFQLSQTLGADVCLILSLDYEKCAKIVFRYFLQGRNCTEFSNLLCRRRFFLRHHLIQKIWNKTGILIR